MKRVVISGYFNPLHGGHLDMIEAAAKLGDYLIVIVNNDKQQLLKKGKIILDQENRMRLMCALRDVNKAVLSVDEDPSVIRTLDSLAQAYPDGELVFANGGDRDSEKAIPEAEVCERRGIHMVFGVGFETRGLKKPDSSTRINQTLGHVE